VACAEGVRVRNGKGYKVACNILIIRRNYNSFVIKQENTAVAEKSRDARYYLQKLRTKRHKSSEIVTFFTVSVEVSLFHILTDESL